MKSGIFPLNTGEVTDRYTAPAKVYEEASVSDNLDGAGTSVDQSNSTTDDNADSLTERLKDVLVLPKAKSTKRSRSTNSSARCITDDSFIEEVYKKLEEKESEKRKRKHVGLKEKKSKPGKETGTREGKTGKGNEKSNKEASETTGETVKDGNAATEACICPDCGVDYYEEETDAEWIGCDGGCGQWWHVSCTELLEVPASEYYCPECSIN